MHSSAARGAARRTSRLGLDPLGQLLGQRAHARRLVGQRAGALQEADAVELRRHRRHAQVEILLVGERGILEPADQHVLVACDHDLGPGGAVGHEDEARRQAAASAAIGK